MPGISSPITSKLTFVGKPNELPTGKTDMIEPQTPHLTVRIDPDWAAQIVHIGRTAQENVLFRGSPASCSTRPSVQ